MTRNTLLLGIGAVFALLLTICLPVKVEGRSAVDVRITATGKKDPNGKSAEVWLNMPAAGMLERIKNKWSKTPGWEIRNGRYVSYQNQPANLTLRLQAAEGDELRFARHPFSGEVVLEINGDIKVYNLYAKEPQELRIDLAPYLAVRKSYFAGFANFLTVLLISWAGFVIFGRYLVDRRPRTGGGETRSYTALLFAAPSLGIFLLVHLAYWPAQMSPDSLDQWQQVLSGDVTDNHSAVLTFIYRGLHLIASSPALPVFAQYLLLSVIWGLLLLEVQRRGAHHVILWVFALLLPLYPATFLVATTLWKDVVYAASLLGLAYVALRGARLEWKLSIVSWWMVFLVGLAVATVRHNGILVAIPFLIVLGLLEWKSRAGKVLLGQAVAIAVTVIVLKIVVYPSVSVEPIGDRYKAMHALHLLGAMVSSDVRLSPEQERVVFDVAEKNTWQSQYDCRSVVPLFWDPKILAYPLEERYGQLNRVALDLAIRNPGILLKHQLCVTSLLWRITARPGEYVAISPNEITRLPVAQELALDMSPAFPKLRERLSRLTESFVINNPVLGRPALLSLVGLFCSTLFALFDRRRLWILYLPALLNTASLALLMSAQDYRYQYPVVLSAILMLCIAFSLSPTGQREKYDASKKPVSP